MGCNIPEKHLERFWSKVNKAGNCWEWTGRVDVDGYGQFDLHKKIVLAHRLSFLLASSETVGNLWVLHRCDNRKCVNPGHLFLGTTQDNMTDAANKGRLAKGPQLPNAKLTEQIVVSIRERYAKGDATQRALAKEYGVTHKVIQFVLTRRSWKHVP